MIRDYDLREGCRELYNKKAKEVKQFFDFKDCLFVHTTTTTKYTNLRKWVQYWANNYGDADQVLKTLGNRDVLVEICKVQHIFVQKVENIFVQSTALCFGFLSFQKGAFIL